MARFRPVLAAVLAAAVWNTAGAQSRPGSSGTPGQSEVSPRLLIAALDSCIQKRFSKIEERFGMTRIVRLDDTPHVFRPGDTAEWDAVHDLDRAGLEVVLYVAGRRVLTADPGTASLTDARGWSIVKGPVEITRGSATRPASAELFDAARRTFATPDGEAHEFSVGPWQFIGRTVRATETACLQCHARSNGMDLRRGDPLGVVLYGFRSR